MMAYLKQFVGQSFKQQTSLIKGETVGAYLRECDAPNFMLDEVESIALPTFLSMFPYHSPLNDVSEDVILFNIANTFELVEPLPIGSAITTEASITDIRIRAKMVFVHLKCQYMHEEQQIGMGTIIWMMDPTGVTTELINRQTKTEGSVPHITHDNSAFPCLSPTELLEVGHVLPSFCNGPLTRKQIQCYVEQTGDKNPIHVDNKLARRLGYPGVVIPGLMKMVLLEQYVIRCVGDRGRIIKLTAHYKSTDYAGNSLIFEATINRITDKGNNHCYVELDLNVTTEMSEISTTGSCIVLLEKY